MEKHLKSHEYYVDLYDRHTVELCRDLEKIHLTKELPPMSGKDFSKDEEIRTKIAFSNLHMWFVSSERYKKK